MYPHSFSRIEGTNVAVGETTDVAKMTICGTFREDHKAVAKKGGRDGYYIVCGTKAQGRYIHVTKNTEKGYWLRIHEFEAWSDV